MKSLREIPVMAYLQDTAYPSIAIHRKG